MKLTGELRIKKIACELDEIMAEEALATIYTLNRDGTKYALRVLVNLPEMEETLPKVSILKDPVQINTDVGKIIKYTPKEKSTRFNLYHIAMDYEDLTDEEAKAFYIVIDDPVNPNPPTKRGTVTTVMRPNF